MFHWCSQDKKVIIAVTFLILVIFLILIILLIIPNEVSLEFSRNKIIQPQTDTISRKLDGILVDKNQSNIWPVALMIDNHPEVWEYQTGLNSASLVYSTLVEGSYTRLMAVYAGNQANKIGPIRSARPYFVRLAREVNALYGHSGGSPQGIQTIEDLKVYNLEEATSYGPEYIWRDKQYPAPHNLFTSSDKLAKAISDWDLDKKTPDYQAWKFRQNLNIITGKEDKAFNVFISYSPVNYFNVSYKLNPNSGQYLRSQGDQPHLDNLTGNQISVTNIIIQFVPQEVVLDKTGRLSIDLLGQGDARVIKDGYITESRWEKEDNFSRTIFYDSQGQEIEFSPGNIWVEIVPGDREVVVE